MTMCVMGHAGDQQIELVGESLHRRRAAPRKFSAVRHGGAVIDIGFIELIGHTCLCDAVVEH